MICPKVLTLLFATILALSAGCERVGNRNLPNNAERAPPDSRSAADTKTVAPRFDLSSLTGYDLRVVAVSGKPIGNEKAVVQEITNWSLNRHGQIAVRAEKKTPGSYVVADLFRIDNGRPVFLMSQRPEAEPNERRRPTFDSRLITDEGQVFVVSGISSEETETPKLWFVDENQVTPVMGSAHLYNHICAGGHGQVAFMTWERSRSTQQIVAGNSEKTKVVLSAENDPSQPTRQFRAFGRIWSINANGQILFDASVGRDPFDDHRLFLYSPPPRSTSRTNNDQDGLEGTVRGIAQHGGRLMGTKLTLANNNGHDVWTDVQLSDGGDVAIFAQLKNAYDRVEALFVLRPNSDAWQVIVQPGQPFGQPPLPIKAVSPATSNGRGQLACVVHIDLEEEYKQVSQLLRVEPDGKITALFQDGDATADGVRLTSPQQPQILSGGEIVFLANAQAKDQTGPLEKVIAVTDGNRLIVAARSTDWQNAVPTFDYPRLETFKSSDDGHIGVFIVDGPYKHALLLATPKHSVKF